MTSEQEFPKTIGDKPHKKSAQNLSNGIKTRNPIANRQQIALEKELPEQTKGTGGAQRSTSDSRHQDGTITAGEEECKNQRSPIKERSPIKALEGTRRRS